MYFQMSNRQNNKQLHDLKVIPLLLIITVCVQLEAVLSV